MEKEQTNITFKLFNGNLLGIVFLILLVMKLAGWGLPATLSWWWITCPLWIPFAVIFGIIGIATILGAIYIIGYLIVELYYRFVSK